MAYPNASTPIATSFSVTATSMAVAMPATVAAGTLLVALVESRYTETWTPPSGWTSFFTQVGGSSIGQLSGFYSYATGSEGGTTPSWSCTTATTAVWQVIAVTGTDGITAPNVAITADDSTTNPNSPTLAPAWGVASTLWLAVAGDAATNAAFTGAPSGFTGFTNTGLTAGGADTELATATLQATVSSETPGAWGYGSNRYWATATIAIKAPTTGPTYVNETMAAAPTTGMVASGGAAVYGWQSGGWWQFNNNINQWSNLYYTGALSYPFTAKMDMQMTSTSGADGMWFFFGASAIPQTESDTIGGYLIFRSDITNTIQLRYNGSVVNSMTYAKDTTFRHLEVSYDGTTFNIIFSGGVTSMELTDSQTLSGTYFGWGARSGGTGNTHNMKNLSLTGGGGNAGQFFTFF